MGLLEDLNAAAGTGFNTLFDFGAWFGEQTIEVQQAVQDTIEDSGQTWDEVLSLITGGAAFLRKPTTLIAGGLFGAAALSKGKEQKDLALGGLIALAVGSLDLPALEERIDGVPISQVQKVVDATGLNQVEAAELIKDLASQTGESLEETAADIATYNQRFPGNSIAELVMDLVDASGSVEVAIANEIQEKLDATSFQIPTIDYTFLRQGGRLTQLAYMGEVKNTGPAHINLVLGARLIDSSNRKALLPFTKIGLSPNSSVRVIVPVFVDAIELPLWRTPVLHFEVRHCTDEITKLIVGNNAGFTLASREYKSSPTVLSGGEPGLTVYDYDGVYDMAPLLASAQKPIFTPWN